MSTSFIDTNVLVYTDDQDDPVKQARALDLLAQLRGAGNGVLSTQVLSEYFHAATKKLGVDAALARRKVELFSRFRLVGIDVDMVLAAIDLHRLHQFAIWDALVIKAAQTAHCRELVTEDLQHGQVIDGLRIRNPFLVDS